MWLEKMTTNFDPIGYVQKSRALGIKQEIAEFQAQELEKVIKEITHNQELVTKSDLFLTKNELQTAHESLKKELRADNALLKKELQSEIISLKKELQADNVSLRKEFQADNASLRKEFQADNASLRKEFQIENISLKTEFQLGIANLRIELIKWVIGTAITTSVTLSGMMFTMFKFIR